MSDLEDILVVSLEHAVAAPMASRCFADAGARVIKIERESGDFARWYDEDVNGESAYFVWLNRGKESICLNLRKENDKTIFENLLTKADVFIQNMAPGAVDRLGFSYDTVAQKNPQIVYCSISGYGVEEATGKKAYDLLIQAESGLSSITGNEAGLARVGISICDISTGTTAFQLVLQALYARTKTGKGRFIDVSLYHSMSDWMNVPFLQYKYGGKMAKPTGVKHPSIAPYGQFVCKDGKSLLIAIQSQGEWEILCTDVFEQPDLIRDQRFLSNSLRCKNREAVDTICAEYFKKHTRDNVMKILEKHRVAVGLVTEVSDIEDHPSTRMMTCATETQEIELIAPVPPEINYQHKRAKVPALNEHSDKIRDEFSELQN